MSAFELATSYTQLLCQARTSWEAIIREIGDIAVEIPEKSNLAAKWISEYQRIGVQISGAIALMILADYAGGRAILETEYNPLNNIRAQIGGALFKYAA